MGVRQVGRGLDASERPCRLGGSGGATSASASASRVTGARRSSAGRRMRTARCGVGVHPIRGGVGAGRPKMTGNTEQGRAWPRKRGRDSADGGTILAGGPGDVGVSGHGAGRGSVAFVSTRSPSPGAGRRRRASGPNQASVSFTPPPGWLPPTRWWRSRGFGHDGDGEPDRRAGAGERGELHVPRHRSECGRAGSGLGGVEHERAWQAAHSGGRGGGSRRRDGAGELDGTGLGRRKSRSPATRDAVFGAVAQAPHAVGAMTTATVSGLTNRKAYSFAVTAVNAFGSGKESAASNPVTPSVPRAVVPDPPPGRATTAPPDATSISTVRPPPPPR